MLLRLPLLPAVGSLYGAGTGQNMGHLLALPFSEDRYARDPYYLSLVSVVSLSKTRITYA